MAWCRISAGVNRIANRFFIVKAVCRNPTIPRAEQAEKGDANTSSRKGQTRVNYRKLITSWISIFSRYRDHNLQTELRKISFKLFSNRSRILCGAKIQDHTLEFSIRSVREDVTPPHLSPITSHRSRRCRRRRRYRRFYFFAVGVGLGLPPPPPAGFPPPPLGLFPPPPLG